MANGGSYAGGDGGLGGGGRIAVYYNQSSFSISNAHANAGGSAAGAGTVAFIDVPNNNLYAVQGFEFQQSPFSFSNIYINNTRLRTNASSLMINATSFSIANSNFNNDTVALSIYACNYTASGSTISASSIAIYGNASESGMTYAPTPTYGANPACTAPVQLQCPSGMVSYWTFDNQSNVGKDSANVNNALNNGATWISAGKVDGALQFNNAGLQSATFNGLQNGNVPFTVEAWVKSSSGATQGIFSIGVASPSQLVELGLLGYTPTLRIIHGWNDFGSTPLSLNAWHHVAATFDGSNEILYLDGSAVESRVTTINFQNMSGFRIGTLINGYPFNGQMDEVAIYNRSLSASEIYQHYNSGQHYMGMVSVCCVDNDGDGYGIAGTNAGCTYQGVDCDDSNPGINPGATETCNGIDDNCDGNVDTILGGYPAGMVGYWTFDNQSNVGKDSVNSNDATNNGATWASGKVGGALSFDGSSSYVSLPSAAGKITENHTVEFWMKSSGPTGYNFIFNREYRTGGGNGNGFYDLYWSSISPYNLVADSWVIVNGGWQNATVAAPSSYADGNWHHVVMTKAGATIGLYVDSSLIGTASNPNLYYPDPPTNFYLGRTRTGYYWPGMLDEVAIYNRTLTQQEIQQHFSLGNYYGSVSVCCVDNDHDGYNVSAGGTNCGPADCDDSNAAVHPGATETCNGVDDNCDGQVDTTGTSCPSGMVSYWQAEGNAKDSSDGNDGTLMNGATFATSKTGLGQAFSFDGTNDYVNITNGANPSMLFVEAWVKPSPVNYAPIISDYSSAGGYGLYNNGGKAYVAVRIGGSYAQLTGTKNIDDGQWHHVAAYYDNVNTVYIYVDGQLDKSGNEGGASGAYTSKTSPTFIGANPIREPGVYFNGLIDEVAVYNRAPLPQEIQQHYNNGIGEHYCSAVVSVCCVDNDNDGYGIAGTNAGCTYQGVDCDDSNPGINPGATETCNGIDDNCDGNIDPGCNCTNGQTAPCGSNVGECRQGTKTCVNGQWSDQCVGEIPPTQETCNGKDDNCDGTVDEGVKTIYYRDSDNDGYGDINIQIQACSVQSGYVENSQDCNDNDNTVHPNAPDSICNGVDNNCDTNIDEGYVTDTSCYLPGACAQNNAPSTCVAGVETYCGTGTPSQELCDVAQVDEDCDAQQNEGCECTVGDQKPCGPSTETGECRFGTQTCDISGTWGNCAGEVMPTDETCNGRDDDCDGVVDNGFAIGNACTNGIGECVASGTTVCNNAGNDVICDAVPGTPKPEVCDGLDNNCDGATDEPENLVLTSCEKQDGVCAGSQHSASECFSGTWGACTASDYGSQYNEQEFCPDNNIDNNCDGTNNYNCNSCDADNDGYRSMNSNPAVCTGYPAQSDCDDTDAAIHPGASESCNGIDDNCNSIIDEGFDQDGDNFTTCNGDCDDGNANINPSAQEICNLIDDNCNNIIDEGVKTTYYRDADGDGYGNPAVSTQACSAPAGYVSNSQDCNDNSAAINPGAVEVPCDNIDNDCSGTDFEGTDGDHDGFRIEGGSCGPVDCDDGDASINPSATEICNGIDDNCNNMIDSADSAMQIAPCEKQDGVCSGSSHLASQCAAGSWQQCDASNYGASYHDEYCPDDGIDNNCDGVNTYDCVWRCDSDSDGYKPDGAPWFCFFYQEGDCNDNSANVHPGAEEACNGVDDDCNANTLDGISESWYNTPTECGVGECASSGVYTCQEGSQFSTCVEGIPTAETCDSRDNNCDGTVDEMTRNCSENYDGICGLGTELCSAGQWSGCPLPQQELCNGKDDNCNGKTDEDSKVQFIFNQWQNWGAQRHINASGIAPVVYADSIAGSPFASGSFVPVNITYTTTNKNVPGLAIDSGLGYFDVWLWGKNDGITKKAVNVTMFLDGITVKSIANIQGAPYEKNRDGKAKFGNPGQDQVWVQSGNMISFVATVSSANDAFRVYYVKSICTNNDADNDTIPDYLDICPDSRTDANIQLDKNNHFADVNMNGIFETKIKTENATCKNVTYRIGSHTYTKKECHKDYIWVIVGSDYTLQDTFGCTCSDILAKKPGSDRGQLKYGCTEGTLESWIAEVGYNWKIKK